MAALLPLSRSGALVIDPHDTYIWTRRFESEEERDQLYEAVYETETWKNEIAPPIADMLDRDRARITLVEPTAKSIIR